MNTPLFIYHFSRAVNCINSEGRAPIITVITAVFFARALKTALIIRGLSPENTAKNT